MSDEGDKRCEHVVTNRFPKTYPDPSVLSDVTCLLCGRVMCEECIEVGCCDQSPAIVESDLDDDEE